MEHLQIILAQILVLLFSIIFHEVAHGYTALRLGDPTAYYAGRLTMDPRPHIDPMMSIFLPVMTFLTMGFVFGGARPVPINPRNFRYYKRDMALTAAAGPLSNLLLAVAGGLLLRLSWLLPFPGFLVLVLHMTVIINLLLAFFNLLPIPPLDGSRVVAYFLPPHLEAGWRNLDRYGILIILGLFWLGGGLFSGLLFGLIRMAGWLITGQRII